MNCFRLMRIQHLYNTQYRVDISLNPMSIRQGMSVEWTMIMFRRKQNELF